MDTRGDLVSAVRREGESGGLGGEWCALEVEVGESVSDVLEGGV